MKISQILKKAEEMGIKLGWVIQTDLIKAIQRAEGNMDCYATDRNRTCVEEGCLWREGCLKPQKEMAQSPSEEAVAFIIRRLRNSAAVLSLIAENAKKRAKDERFLMYSFEALVDQVRKIDEVIQICFLLRE